jgi:hypothetical protein
MRAFIRFLAPSALLLTLLAPAGAATAAPATVDRFETFFFEDFGCGGEDAVRIEGEGTFQQVRKDEFRHRTLHGTAVDDQGNEYVFQRHSINRSTAEETFFATRLQLISKGSAPNQWFSASERNGKITIKQECRG